MYVLIIQNDTNEIVNSMGPMDRGSADAVERGAGINLAWDRYRVTTVGDDEVHDEGQTTEA
jgi:hypothetical protein